MSANVLVLEGWLKTDAQVRDNLARFTLCFESYDSDTRAMAKSEIICELFSRNMRSLGGYLKGDKQVTLTGKLKFSNGDAYMAAWDVALHGNRRQGNQGGQGGGSWSQGGY